MYLDYHVGIESNYMYLPHASCVKLQVAVVSFNSLPF